MRPRALWPLALPILLMGCFLFETSDPPRFFRPESAALDGAGDDGSADASSEGAPVRLHVVSGASFLGERVVWRVSPVEYGLYEQRRWIELPTRYVRRALATTLRRTPGVRLTTDPGVAQLDVEILAFDEVLAPTHEASVALAVSLRDGKRGALLERTFAAQVPISDGDPTAMARAMGHALDEVVGEVAQAVAARVASGALAPSTHARAVPPASRGARTSRTDSH